MNAQQKQRQDVDSRRRLWLRGFIWLLFLAPYFFLTYGQVNQFTATRTDVAIFVFDWESNIPFWPWTIVPYWSIDLLYGLSLFICTTRRELMIHGCRLLAASAVACVGFLLFPLRFSFVRPVTDGTFGWLFQQLEMFDLPYNQAPSLHIILLWILWLRFYPHTSVRWRWLLHSWFALIGISVLTTWQHHFIDVITGLFVGVLLSYALPMNGRWHWQPSQDSYASRLAAYYGLGGLTFVVLAAIFGGFCWLLLWPAMALFIVMLGYLGLGSAVFQKNQSGQMSPSARLLLAPYQLGAWLSFRYFSAKCDVSNEIVSGLMLGSYPRQPLQVKAVLDMTAEWPRSRYVRKLPYIACPQLDLLSPDAEQIQRAVLALNQLQLSGAVLVHCALGLSRSAIIAAAWLVQQKRVDDVSQAIKLVQTSRPDVVLKESHRHALEQWAKQYV